MAELSTLARPYAKAAFETAVASSTLAQWSEQLHVAAGVCSDNTIHNVLSSPSLTAEQQAQTFIDVCGDALGDGQQNLVRILSENKRLPLLVEIAKLFDQFKAQREKSVDLNITTAFMLDEDAEQQLASAFSRKFEREVNVSSVVDKDLLGGVVVRAGDLVIDGSLRGRLAKLAEAMNS